MKKKNEPGMGKTSPGPVFAGKISAGLSRQYELD